VRWSPAWIPLSIGLAGAAPFTELVLPQDTTRRFLKVRVD